MNAAMFGENLEKSTCQNSAKKPYSSPKLVVYGTLEQLTAGHASVVDGKSGARR
jgi:hypothetical protein